MRQILMRVKMLDQLLLHAAGDRTGNHALGVDAVGVEHVGLRGGNAANAVMLRGGAVAKLQHIAQHRDTAAIRARTEARKDLKRGLRRFRACVIAVLDDGKAIALVDLLAHTGVVKAGDLRLNRLRRDLQEQGCRNGGQRVIDRMATQNRHEQLETVAETADDKAHAVVKLLNVGRKHVAGMVLNAVIIFFMSAVGAHVQKRLVAVEHADSIFRHAAENFELGL